MKIKSELIKYILVGMFVVFLDFLFYQLFINVFEINSSNSKRLSFISGAVFSFFLHKHISFNSNKRRLKEPFLFGLLYFTSFSLNSFSHDLSIKYFAGNYPFYIATSVSVVINYLGQKFIVFKNR